GRLGDAPARPGATRRGDDSRADVQRQGGGGGACRGRRARRQRVHRQAIRSAAADRVGEAAAAQVTRSGRRSRLGGIRSRSSAVKVAGPSPVGLIQGGVWMSESARYSVRAAGRRLAIVAAVVAVLACALPALASAGAPVSPNAI